MSVRKWIVSGVVAWCVTAAAPVLAQSSAMGNQLDASALSTLLDERFADILKDPRKLDALKSLLDTSDHEIPAPIIEPQPGPVMPIVFPSPWPQPTPGGTSPALDPCKDLKLVEDVYDECVRRHQAKK